MTTSPPAAERLRLATATEWRAALDADPEAVVSQSPEWVATACADGTLVDRTAAVGRGDRELVLPLVRRRRAPSQLARAGSMPAAWGYGGIVGRPDVDDVRDALRDLAATGWLQTVIRPLPDADPLWRRASDDVRAEGVRIVRIPRRAHVVDLDGGRDAVWGALSSSRRRGVRKAEKAGLEVVDSDDGRLLDDYHHLFEQSVLRWAEHQREPASLARARARRRDPKEKLRRLMTLPGGRSRVSIAYLAGEPVAGVVVLQDRNAHYTRGAMDKERASATNANDLLMWRAIEYAVDGGCRRFHMGESGTSANLASYKERFGARAVDYGEYRVERLPLTAVDQRLRRVVKAAVGFRDA